MSNAKNLNSCCLDQCLPLLKKNTITPNGVIGFTSNSLALGSVLSVRRDKRTYCATCASLDPYLMFKMCLYLPHII